MPAPTVNEGDPCQLMYTSGTTGKLKGALLTRRYPREIEEVLIRHPAVADFAVIGISHPTWGETVKAFVALTKGHTIDEQGVIDFCKKSQSIPYPRN